MGKKEVKTNAVRILERNKIEYATICTKNPLNYSGQKVGMLTGISARSLMPAAAKCILSETELAENEKPHESVYLFSQFQSPYT